MSVKNTNGNNVLPFKRAIPRTAPEKTAEAELMELLITYDHLIALLRDTCDEGLDNLADNIVVSVVDCRAALASGMDAHAGRKMEQEMRAGLHEFPRILRSLLPGIGPRLGESMERKLGIRFSGYE